MQNDYLERIADVVIGLIQNAQALDLLLPAADFSAQDEPGGEGGGNTRHHVVEEQSQRPGRAHVDQDEVEDDAHREDEEAKGVRGVTRGANGEATGKKKSAIHNEDLTLD